MKFKQRKKIKKNTYSVAQRKQKETHKEQLSRACPVYCWHLLQFNGQIVPNYACAFFWPWV